MNTPEAKANALETYRRVKEFVIGANLVCADVLVVNLINPFLSHEFVIDPEKHPLIFRVLQNIGDLPYGYFISLGVHEGLSKVAPKLSEKFKAGISIATATAVISSVELGWVPFLGTADPTDIPAGIIGSLIYAGVHYWQRRGISEGNIAAVIPPQG